MSLSLRKITAALALAGVAAPGLSIAQDSSAPFMEEIVVTATKRAQTLQDIPIAVSVTSSETIERAQIQDISDLQSVVPSLRVSQLQSSTNTNFVIRGFGNGANNPGIEPSVGVFIDGVYRSRSAGAISDLPNLERVEVLRGPQSTLFGKNASAGVINIVTAKPSGESAGQVSGTIGNYGQFIAKGNVEAALSDTAAFSLAASTNTRDGYVENTNPGGGSDLNNRDRQSFRGQLLLNPSDATEIRFIADYDTIDEKCCATVNIVAGPTLGAIQFAGGDLIANDRESLETKTNIDPNNQLDNTGLSMQIDHDFDSFTFTSITSFRNVDSRYDIDADFTSADIITNEILSDIDTFTQEFRLTSTGGDKLDWMVGGFYFDESVEYQDDLPFGTQYRRYLDALAIGAGAPGAIGTVEAILGLPVGQAFGQVGQGFTHQSTLDNEAISLFGQFDFHLSDALTATVGLSYTKDEKQASTTQTRADAFSGVDRVELGTAVIFNALTGLAPTPQNFALVPSAFQGALGAASNPATNPFAGLAGFQFLPPYVDFPNAVESGESDDDELSYTFRLAYDVNDSLNVYGGVSTGFKATSWNLSRDAAPFAEDVAALRAAGLIPANFVSGTRFAGPEEATVYELGLKSSFERGSFNIALFDQSIKGFQSNAFVGTGFNLTSAGEQSTKGVEFDLVYYPTDSLQLTLSGTLLDPTYDSFEGAGRDPLTGEVVDLTGVDPAGINEVSLSTSFTYRFNLGSNDAYFRGDYFYEDSVPIGDLAISAFERETKNLNLAAGINTESGLGFSIWVRNATDHASLISAFASVAQAGSFSGYRTQPRTYGITVSKDF
ncbi:TonB-dependent receptor [Arenicella xantha]|uniref:TonB-dependent receptor-like protein n=1 Tax=Arenicella xantha TaxID=644221 RepID=A0A395JHI1_9GAMM|nr:TonB-dependent receptor [Arenicella xantha]RBP48319.1 TonB-dependent receptor-like protein [Arenicella xantha]